MSSFCTSRRIAKSSHRLTMLRFRHLALHKNNLIIDDFRFGFRCNLRHIPKGKDLRAVRFVLSQRSLFCDAPYLASSDKKNNLIIDDIFTPIHP